MKITFECEFCHSSFTLKNNLRVHMKSYCKKVEDNEIAVTKKDDEKEVLLKEIDMLKQ